MWPIHMTAVIKNDVGHTDLVNQALEELAVLLRPDVDLNLILFKRLAFRINVDTDAFARGGQNTASTF